MIKSFKKRGKYTKEVPLSDTYGTSIGRVGCYVPILTRCPSYPLHRSKRGRIIITKKTYIKVNLGYFKSDWL